MFILEGRRVERKGKKRKEREGTRTGRKERERKREDKKRKEKERKREDKNRREAFSNSSFLHLVQQQNLKTEIEL